MIELSDFLGNILAQVSEARKQADIASVQLAKTYAEDNLLRTLPVPRVRLPEMEITLPVYIKDVKRNRNFNRKDFDSREIAKLSYNILTTELEKTYKKSHISQTDIIGIHRNVLKEIAILKNKLKHTPNSSKISRNTFVDNITNHLIKTKKLTKATKTTKMKNNIIRQLDNCIKKEIEESAYRDHPQIKFGITNNDIKELTAAENQIITLKLKLKEEGIELIEKDNNSEADKKSTNNTPNTKNIDDYFLSIE